MLLSQSFRAQIDAVLAAILLAERGPSESDLSVAPKLEMWSPLISVAGCVILCGDVKDHPTLGIGRITTSALLAIDTDSSWARTQSRWYRLGRSFDNFAEELSAQVGAEPNAEQVMSFDCPGFQRLSKDANLLEAIAAYIRQIRELDARDMATRSGV